MGGWVSNDEACVNYMQAINQLSEGHRWLEENVFKGEVKRGIVSNPLTESLYGITLHLCPLFLSLPIIGG